MDPQYFQHKLSLLSPTKSYVAIDLNITQDERKVIDDFIIDKNKNIMVYTIHDNYKDTIKTSLQQFTKNNTDTINNMYKLIIRIIQDVIRAYGKEAAGVIIRITLPNNLFDKPRWHCDGRYFDTLETGLLSKFVIALKGPTTLICVCDQDTRKKWRELLNNLPRPAIINDDNKLIGFNKDIELENNKKIYEFFHEAKRNNKAEFKQVKENSGCGVVFIVANDEYEAIHSEPPLTTDRIFISMVPGTKENIQEWYDRWYAFEQRKK